MKKILHAALALISVVTMSRPIMAAEGFWTPEILSIVLKTPNDTPYTVGDSQWLQTCSHLSDGFQVARGPHGYGMFRDFSCAINKRVMSGPSNRNTFAWTLTVEPRDEDIRISFSNRLNFDAYGPSEIILPKTTNPFDILSDPDFVDLLALAFLDTMPAAMVAGPTEISKDGSKRFLIGRPSHIKGKFFLPAPSPYMNLFRFTVNEKRKWIKPDIVGAIKFRGYRPFGSTSLSSKPMDEPHVAVWEIEESSPSYLTDPTIVIQNQDGVRTRFQNLSATVVSAWEFLAFKKQPTGENAVELAKSATLFEKAAGLIRSEIPGKFGVRYGYSLNRDDPLLKNAALFSLFTETKQSDRRAFRFHYDLINRIKSSTTNAAGESVESSLRIGRAAFAWQFDFDVRDYSKGFIDTVGLIPRISVWNLNLTQKSDTKTSDFTIEREPSIGWDFAAQKRVYKYNTRVYIGAETAGFVGKIINSAADNVAGRSATVTSLRYGTDITMDDQPFKIAMLSEETQWRPSYTLFVQSENFSLSRNRVENTTDSTSAKISLTVLGIGANISW